MVEHSMNRGDMKTKALLALVAVVAVFATVAHLRSHHRQSNPQPDQSGNLSGESGTPQPLEVAAIPARSPEAITRRQTAGSLRLPDLSIPVTNKLERLAQIRESFQNLAAGDPETALRVAIQITNETERETALLTLVTQWTGGELGPPRERARAIEIYGLEAGLGMELAKVPQLAVTWANTVTDGPGRVALLGQAAIFMTASDPAPAFALGDALPEEQRRRFFDSVFAGWAAQDTEAALNWADQLADPSQHEQAIQAIRTQAPVGIGTALAMQDGYPVVQQLMSGAPAELSGQIHPGDRILALAQGDSSFVDAHGVPLSDLVQMIRGAPGTTLQLQILSADAPSGSSPQTISITRDQIKFKH
jgi:hypothetical protein